MYQKIAGGGYLMRVAIHLISSWLFIVGISLTLLQFLYDGGALFKVSSYIDMFQFLFVYPGVVPVAAPIWAQYFRPSFHPTDRDNSKLIAHWSAELSSTDAAK